MMMFDDKKLMMMMDGWELRGMMIMTLINVFPFLFVCITAGISVFLPCLLGLGDIYLASVGFFCFSSFLLLLVGGHTFWVAGGSCFLYHLFLFFSPGLNRGGMVAICTHPPHL
jgi:hypothetical protein